MSVSDVITVLPTKNKPAVGGSALKKIALAALWVAVFGGCAETPPVVRAALREDLPTLKREISRAEQAGRLNLAELTRLARALVAREIASAKGPSGARHVRALRACAFPVLDRLRVRSSENDEVAAEAMLVRLTQNDVESARLMAAYRESASPVWRAVAARAALAPADVLLRQRWFLDPDERVRRAAFEAAQLAPDRSDVPALLEAARLDPDPLSRSLAARALGALGGERAVLGLVDRFARAEEADRLALVDALAMSAAFQSGGARELRAIADGKYGVVSLSAAGALLRNGVEDGALVGHLASAIEAGSTEERRLAIGFARSSDASARSALEHAAADADPSVSIPALARLLEVPAKRSDAERRLRKLALRTDDSGGEARLVLAGAQDRSVVPALTRDVEHRDPSRRESAAVALFRLGETGKAARALGDVDPEVRIGVSCAVLRDGS